MNLEQRRAFLLNYNELVALFGQDLVDEGLSRYTDSQLFDAYQIPLADSKGRPNGQSAKEPWQTPHILLGEKRTHYRFVNASGWEKMVYVPVTEWLVPAAFQNKYQAEHILRPALLALRPWLASFRLALYARAFTPRHDEDFYVKLGYGYWKNSSFDCLYVPMAAFLRGDVDAIVARNRDYFKWYTKTDDVWNTMKLDPTVLAFLALTEENAK